MCSSTSPDTSPEPATMKKKKKAVTLPSSASDSDGESNPEPATSRVHWTPPLYHGSSLPRCKACIAKAVTSREDDKQIKTGLVCSAPSRRFVGVVVPLPFFLFHFFFSDSLAGDGPRKGIPGHDTSHLEGDSGALDQSHKVRLVGAARVKNCDFLSKNPKQQVTTSGHFTFFSSECTCIRLWACNLDHTLTIWLVWG